MPRPKLKGGSLRTRRVEVRFNEDEIAQLEEMRELANSKTLAGFIRKALLYSKEG